MEQSMYKSCMAFLSVVVEEKCYLHDKKKEGKMFDNCFRKLRRGMFNQEP